MKQLDPKKTIFLIDGSSFLYRAYYGVRPLHTPQGVPVQAVFSFCRMIKKLIDTYNPQYIALVWDSKGKTTRHAMYPEYKATRQAPPSDLFEQKDLIIQFADLIGLTQVKQTGVEADDLMFSIAKERTKESDTAIFLTSDKDMGQALSDKIVMFDTFKDKFIDVATYEQIMGFSVAKAPFYFSLLGDASDNIPGVRGIGKKTAAELVNQFDSLEDLYARLDDVPKKRMATALKENKDNAFLSRDLFLLQYDDTKLDKNDLAFDKNNWRKAAPFFKELNFKSLLQGLGKAAGPTVDAKIEVLKQYDFQTVTTAEQLDAVCALIEQHKAFAIDTETDGLRPLENKMIGISISVKKGQAFYIPCAHVVDEPQLSSDDVRTKLGPLLADGRYKKYMHNAKFDLLVFAHAGMQVRGLAFDTMVAAKLIAENWQSISLKELSLHYLDEHMLTFFDVVKANKFKDFSEVPFELATYYAANDAHQTLRLMSIFEKMLKKEKLETLFYEMEMPLISVLFAMEKHGILLDVPFLKKLDKKVTKSIDLIEKDILKFVDTDEPINFNSPRQVEKLLFTTLLLPTQKKSAKRTSYSTDQEVLTVLANMHPVPGLILRYRELAKLKNTYIDALPTYVNPKTKRVHTTYSQTAVATGRLASSDPNLQNIPADASGYGIEVRAAFKAKKGNVFLSADYSQIELRVLAYFSQDTNLKHAFLAGHDIHAETAARLFDTDLRKVSNEQRQIGKRINFSILYGLTPYGLSKDLGISFTDAKTYIEKYFAQYPAVSEWMDRVVEDTKEHGYVTTLSGRRRMIPGIYESNKNMYEEARRVAINTVAQGTAADIMKIGMINLHDALLAKGIDAQILLQIHDELLISVPHGQLAAAEKLTKKILENAVKWDVPLVVTTRSGLDWKEITK